MSKNVFVSLICRKLDDASKRQKQAPESEKEHILVKIKGKLARECLSQ